MASAKFSKKTFEKEIGKLTQEMQQKIALFGTTVENLTDEELEIDVTPDRPDLLSYQGFKRSFLAFLGKKTGLKEYKIEKPLENYKLTIDSSVKDVRPHTACAIIKGLKLNDEKIKELIDIQEKLHITLGRKRKKLAIGIYPLEKITLPITYKAIEPDKIKFIPLEMDREMNGLQILQKHPAGRDYAHLLAGKSKFPIFIDAQENILSMPPIINSERTGRVTDKTKEVFVECSGFDKNSLEKCLTIIITALADMGGKIYSMDIVGGPKKISPTLNHEKIKVSLENSNKLLGLNLSEKEMKSCLEKMGHNYADGEAQTAAWRVDILHKVDLIEDVAIAYGYDKLDAILPKIATIGQEDKKETLKRKISNIITGLNFLEISNYHLTTMKAQFHKMGIQEKQEKGYIELEESKTENNILRKDLSHYAMKIFSENMDCEYPQKIFETGKVFIKENDKLIEKEKLCLAQAPANFTDIKRIIEYLSRMLGLELEIKTAQQNAPWFIDGRVADITLCGKIIGQTGEIHPKILRKWKIKMPVCLFELDLEPIFKKLI